MLTTEEWLMVRALCVHAQRVEGSKAERLIEAVWTKAVLATKGMDDPERHKFRELLEGLI